MCAGTSRKGAQSVAIYYLHGYMSVSDTLIAWYPKTMQEEHPNLHQSSLTQALWHPIAEFDTGFESYQAALEDHRQKVAKAQAEAATAKKPTAGGGKGANAPPPSVTDLESVLPVPRKQILEAILRCLASLASNSFAPAEWLCTFTPGFGRVDASLGSQALVRLLSHHSPRVQLRALMCLRILGSKSELRNALLSGQLTQELLRLLRTSANGALMIATMKVMHSWDLGL